MGRKEREQKRVGRRQRIKEGENRQRGLGAPARWHLGADPGIGLCGHSSD